MSHYIENVFSKAHVKKLNYHIAKNIENNIQSPNVTNKNNVSTSTATLHNNHETNCNQSTPLLSDEQAAQSTPSKNSCINNKKIGSGGTDKRQDNNAWGGGDNGNSNAWGGGDNGNSNWG